MADPRMDALARALGGGGGDPMAEEMPMPEEGMSGEDPMAMAVTEALTLLEPFMDDPRIAQAALALQEAAGGQPSEMPEESMPQEAMPPGAGGMMMS